MKVTIDLDIDAAKAYMSSAKDKRVENLPLWVALSICLDAYIKGAKDETYTTHHLSYMSLWMHSDHKEPTYGDNRGNMHHRGKDG